MLYEVITIRNSHEAIVNELERYFSLNIIDYTQINNVDKNHLSVLFIATGGVEKLVAHCIEQLPRPTIMLADGIRITSYNVCYTKLLRESPSHGWQSGGYTGSLLHGPSVLYEMCA